jgi:methionine synthase II (cobalamin-independent)
MTNAGTRDMLLVGSVGLANAEEVFRAAGSILGDLVRRIPDGETGNARSVWIQCQIPFFLGNPHLEMVEPDPSRPDGYRPARVPSGGIYSFTAAGRYPGRARLRAGVAPTELRFENLGYADWAEESYGTFRQLKATGTVPAGARFQVSIPSPYVIVARHVLADDQPKVEAAYVAAIAREVERIAAAIPRDELAIQWDCTEPGAYEVAGAGDKREAEARLARLASYVPEGVELGYHLCYGDFEHRHTREPLDTAAMVELANAIAGQVERNIGWVHMPVPRNRSDDAYFAPLRDLTLRPETRLYLGLVHYTDGVEGARKRLAAAETVVRDFGIATECGFGRRPKDQDIRELMRLHVEIAKL